jgi:CRISPR-associated RAMP protein (TIGR02581 family)
MFRKNLNRAVLRVRIDTVTPLLIRAGDAGLDPTAVDLTPVRTRHGRYGATVYIPGSSLKGVLRAAAEADVRDRRFGDPAVAGACADPLDHKQASCSGKTEQDKKRGAPSATLHRAHCLACRLFGSLTMKGRASVRDLMPWAPHAHAGEHALGGANCDRANELELRHGVAIDRITGSVRHGPFDQELVPAGVSFWGEVALENYQVWQLGLLSRSFDQLNDGMAQLGSSKSRGLGAAEIEVESIIHEQAAFDPSGASRPCGAGDLLSQSERGDYGLFTEKPLPGAAGVRRGLAMRYEVSAADVAAWLAAGRAALEGLAP